MGFGRCYETVAQPTYLGERSFTWIPDPAHRYLAVLTRAFETMSANSNLGMRLPGSPIFVR